MITSRSFENVRTLPFSYCTCASSPASGEKWPVGSTSAPHLSWYEHPDCQLSVKKNDLFIYLWTVKNLKIDREVHCLVHTETILFRRLTIFLNISSSLDVSCDINLTILPVLISGTWNVSLSSKFSSIIPLHGKRWITLRGQKYPLYLQYYSVLNHR